MLDMLKEVDISTIRKDFSAWRVLLAKSDLEKPRIWDEEVHV